MNAIEVDGVTKSFGDRVAVKDLSFSIGTGEVFGLLGPNGAGKTTTIRMVLDLIKPDRGRIAVLGEPMSYSLASRIGYLPEERGLYRDVSVVEGLTYLASLKGIGRSTARRRAYEQLERVGLSEAAGQPLGTLSRGNQQKIQFLATVLHEPELVIVDEPFSGLDPINTRLLRDLLLGLREAGSTIVMSTHQMNRVQELCDRLLMLSGGDMVLYGTVAEIRDLFGGDSVLVDAEGDLTGIPGVQAVVDHETMVELVLAERVDADFFLRQLLDRDGVTVRHFEVRRPSLEEVFIAVAGGR